MRHPVILSAALAAGLLLGGFSASAWADRGDRHARYDNGHRGQGYGHAHRHWRGPVIVRPGYGYGHGWVRPIAPYYPRHGLVIRHRPALWSLVTIGAIGYIYANGVYYREHDSGGFEVVAPPADDVVYSTVTAPAPPPNSANYVYPRQGQSADRQASDEYECHRWAVSQTGFDPSNLALGQGAPSSAEQRAGYPRARNACLEGRGYSVR